MSIRHLINHDGVPFDLSELRALKKLLDSLSNDERVKFRNENSFSIAHHTAPKILIVSGPGTGKSFLFLERIKSWLKRDPQGKVIVTSFVRKLVADLENDIENDTFLSDKLNKQITVSTLHKFARRIIEKNRGTLALPLKKYIRIIANPWDVIVWKDVLNFFPGLDKSEYSWKKFEQQLHNNQFENTDVWEKLKSKYFALCKFYNAVGFADLIIRACEALHENPKLNEYNYFIIDEYQDFNLAEDGLISQSLINSNGILLVGDDEQVLYEKLKSGRSTLIRELYRNTEYVKCILPYCSRSHFHISKAAAHFIQQHSEKDTIEKIYLPLKADETTKKIQIIACSHPSSCVDYVRKFISKLRSEIEHRKQELEKGDSKDAFLLILSPTREMNFLRKYKKDLENMVAEYHAENRIFSDDYYKLLSYYSLAIRPQNNFTFRKILYYEGVSEQRVHELIDLAIQVDQKFCEIEADEVNTVFDKCNKIKTAIESGNTTNEKLLNEIASDISITDQNKLSEYINQIRMEKNVDEEDIELEELEIKKMNAIELMTIVRSKGLSADHVILIGFDNVNMNFVTVNAFYVALTRARKSLHLITALKSGGATDAHNFINTLPEEHVEFHSYKKQDQTLTPKKDKQDFNDYIERANYVSYRKK